MERSAMKNLLVHRDSSTASLRFALRMTAFFHSFNNYYKKKTLSEFGTLKGF